MILRTKPGLREAVLVNAFGPVIKFKCRHFWPRTARGRAATPMTVAQALDRLEKHYGKLRPPGPSDPYEMILYANCGYPANDVTCSKGFDALRNQIGLGTEQVLAASEVKLAAIMRLGGIVPELRVTRLKQIAGLVEEAYGGNLASALQKPLAEAKKVLKRFPTIGDPGAEKILLFTKTAPVPAALLRAYLLFQGHGRELCKRSRPMCRSCPVAQDCPYFQGQE